MINIVYFIVVLTATTLGAMTGLGGGVIIKPIMDMIGGYDISTISILSSSTVFIMSIVSIAKNTIEKKKTDYHIAICIASGSVLGGFCGERLFGLLLNVSGSKANASIFQNAVLLVLIVCVVLYMLNKQKIKTHSVNSRILTIIIGFTMGVISSFLGIGGGPINVVILTYFFSYNTKTAAIYSLYTIFFAQATKLITVAFTSGYASYNLSSLPYMAVGAVLGGFLGNTLNTKLPNKKIELCFNLTQVFIIFICLYNIIKYSF